MAGTEDKPEFSAWSLYLVSLAQSFLDCYRARQRSNIFDLYKSMQGASLCLAGHYGKGQTKKSAEQIEEDIRQRIEQAGIEVDKLKKELEEKDEYTIPKALWHDLYILEWDLRHEWKDSGLQISVKPQDDDMADY